MAGDFNPDEVIAIIDRYFGEWKPGQDVRQPVFPALKPITAPRDTTIYGLEAETLWMGWRFDRGNSLQIDTLNIVGSMLSNGTAGLIDLDINNQMKMLGAWAGSESLRDHSAFIMAGTPNCRPAAFHHQQRQARILHLARKQQEPRKPVS